MDRIHLYKIFKINCKNQNVLFFKDPRSELRGKVESVGCGTFRKPPAAAGSSYVSELDTF